ncbi:MAG: SGNH/GDSL hydrolase family protein [Planctomycetaceae bacterium]|nr:SGNH/GDSL hydrolase family protein [Planctomycetaceae bacterium]
MFAVVACLLGFALAAGIAEIGLRVYVSSRGWTPNCYATGAVFFVPDDRTGHTLRPGLHLKSSAFDVQVNSLGFRGPEIDLNKPKGTRRIAVLGGSSVFGYLVPTGKCSCRDLEAALMKQSDIQNAGIDRIEVINAGVPGFNLTQCIGRMENQVAPLKPDIVLLYLGWNDIPCLITQGESDHTPPAPPVSERFLAHSTLYGFLRYRLFPPPAPKFAPPQSAAAQIVPAAADRFRSDLKAMIAIIRTAGAVPVISTQVMAADDRCVSLDRYLGDTPQQIEHNRQLGQWVANQLREAALQQGVHLIDTARLVPCDDQILGDAIHLTAHGHQLVAEAWADELVPLLLEASVAEVHAP